MDRKNILMTTMSMGIGGAETHILELSKTLVQRGHRVTVASNGGVYVKELETAGISHVTVPMNRRSPKALLQSYFALRRLIRRGQFDIVHAHARIPGFLCGLIHQKRSKYAFVTTAHGMFATEGLAGKLSNWGQKTIAVSEDISAYLMEHYGVAKSNIFRTVNGIDMERFSPEQSGDAVRTELGIPSDAPVVLHVSRLDLEPGIVAEQLLELAPTLCETRPDLHILIVGGGDQFERFRAVAETANDLIGRTAVHLTGARTDIAACIAASDVFVGVSRAALEAMSGGRPVVLAGGQGHIGVFDETKLETAQHTNFCGRGLELPSANRLRQDILTCLQMEQSEREALGVYGRELIHRDYSVETMTDDTIAAYKAAFARERRILVSGYYGFRNAGDEAILDAFIQSVRDLPEPVSVTVLSKTPAETAQKHGVAAVYRFNLFSVLRALRRSDLLVSGGGSLLQDKSSTRSIIYYLSIIRLAKFCGKPVMLYANGIGPVDRPRNRRRVKRVINRADIVTLREESSLEELRQMGVSAPPMHVTADPIFLLDAKDETQAAEALRRAGVPEDRPLIGISVRSLRTGAGFVGQMALLCDRLTATLGYQVIFLPMQMPQDVTISQQIMEQMVSPAYILDANLSPEALIGACGRMDLVVAMRLHTMLFAASAETPIIGLICDPKIEYFLEKLDMPSGGAVEDFDPARLFAQICQVLDGRETYRARLSVRVAEMGQKAHENTRLLGGMLG